MKLRSYLVTLALSVLVLFSGSALQAQYVFTPLFLLGSTFGGGIFISGSNLALTFVDQHGTPSSFLYANGRYTLIDDIAISSKTAANGIDGANVVGAVDDYTGVGRGFLYSGGTYTTIFYPGSVETLAKGISGTNIVGVYQDTGNLGHGFLYNGSTYTSLTYPGSHQTAAAAISGSNIVGTYEDTSQVTRGFLYNGGTYTSIFYPGSTKTGVGAISGSNVIGVYHTGNTHATFVGHGFLYNTGVYTAITYPGSAETAIGGISGNTIVGFYTTTTKHARAHGFIFNSGTGTYTSLDYPGSRQTVLIGISGSTIVGAYEDLNFVSHGFTAVPTGKSISLGGNLSFATISTGQTETSVLTITNTGNAPVTVSGITYPTGFSGPFTGPIGPGSSQNVTVSFQPTLAQTYSGNISVASDAVGSPGTIAVTGRATQAVGGIVTPQSAPTSVAKTALARPAMASVSGSDLNSSAATTSSFNETSAAPVVNVVPPTPAPENNAASPTPSPATYVAAVNPPTQNYQPLVASYSYQAQADTSAAAIQDQPPLPAPVAQSTSSSTPVKTAETPKTAVGTGFFVTSDGYLLTNLHAVAGASQIQIKDKKGLQPARLVARDSANDIAVLKVNEASSCLPLGDSDSTKLGQPVFSVSFPQPDVPGAKPKVTKGEVSALTGMRDDHRMYKISSQAQLAGSDGCLVDQQGKLIGMINAQLNEVGFVNSLGDAPEHLNYALKISYAKLLLKGLNVAKTSFAPSTPASSVSLDKAVSGVADATVLVIVR